MQTDPFIPRRLDDQWKLGLWDVDVAAPFLVCLFLGFVSSTGTKGLLIGAVVGVMCSRWFARQKADKHPSYVLHLKYWYLPDVFTPMKATPPSYARRMAG